MEIRRSRNSYILSPRRVTMAPMGIPSRTLKAAMDFLALVVTGFWPAMAARSATRGSMILTFWVASPRPMLMTIFSSLGIAIALVMLSSLARACLISVSYFSLNRAAMIALRFLHGSGVGTVSWGEPEVQGLGVRDEGLAYFFFSAMVLPLALEKRTFLSP